MWQEGLHAGGELHVENATRSRSAQAWHGFSHNAETDFTPLSIFFFLDRRAPALLAQACMYQKFVRIINKNANYELHKKTEKAAKCVEVYDKHRCSFFHVFCSYMILPDAVTVFSTLMITYILCEKRPLGETPVRTEGWFSNR